VALNETAVDKAVDQPDGAGMRESGGLGDVLSAATCKELAQCNESGRRSAAHASLDFSGVAYGVSHDQCKSPENVYQVRIIWLGHKSSVGPSSRKPCETVSPL
jgi:hypothetical protein